MVPVSRVQGPTLNINLIRGSIWIEVVSYSALAGLRRVEGGINKHVGVIAII
jgi:hypothetical protein